MTQLMSVFSKCNQLVTYKPPTIQLYKFINIFVNILIWDPIFSFFLCNSRYKLIAHAIFLIHKIKNAISPKKIHWRKTIATCT